MAAAGSWHPLPEVNASRLEDGRACPGGSPWIWHLLEQCVEDVWEYGSVVIGLVSIVCFLFAALPQLYVAYKNGKVDQALSLGFLLCWLGGDFTNLIGCYLTNQLPIQIVTAIFYVNMDIIMISQFAYYKFKNNKMKGNGSLKGFCIAWVLVFVTLSIILPSQLLLRNLDRRAEMEINEKSLGITEMSGFICGYVSSVFYLGSRFPQLHKNVAKFLKYSMPGFVFPPVIISQTQVEKSLFQRKSTEGTSYMLFALAMLGNFTYGLSLVLKLPAMGQNKNQYIVHHLPWLIGSFGVLVLDFFMTAQFIMYRKHRTRDSNLALEVEPLLVNEEET